MPAALAGRRGGPEMCGAETAVRPWSGFEATAIISARAVKGGLMALQEGGGVILLDVAAGDGEFDRSILEKLGHPVEICNGPAFRELCPLLGGEGCPKFDTAHGIVVELDLRRRQHRMIVERYRELGRPDLPIRVVVKPGEAELYRDLLDQVEVWGHDPTVADLDGFAAEVEAVDRSDAA
jgi:hypothetical protein